MKNENHIDSYQQKFKKFLLGKDPLAQNFIHNDIAIPAVLDEGKKEEFVASRLAVYRNNVFYSLGEALGSLYPVSKRVVGDDCFRSVAGHYILEHPPEDPVLTFYGKNFAEFIAKDKSCKRLHYLKDVAQLEWYCQCSLHAADAQLFDPASLGAMDEKALSNLKLSLEPSARFMVSNFPVDIIWEENQKSEVGLINIDRDNKTYLLIYRKEFQIQVVNLQPTVYYLLEYLAAGVTISQAWEQAQIAVGEQAIGDDEFTNVLVYLLGLAIFSDKQNIQKGLWL